MRIKHVRPYNFRNLSNTKVEFAPGINFIVGENGQGKTNLIEAINLLSLTRSFRTSDSKELIRWGENEASVFALVEQAISEVEVGVALKRGKKEVFINGNKVDSLKQFLGHLICVSFSPTDLNLVKGQPQIRRRFIDKHVLDLQPALVDYFVDNQKAVKNKNNLLRTGKVTSSQLEPWNRLLAESSHGLEKGRLELIEQINLVINEVHSQFSPLIEIIELKLSSKLVEDNNLLSVDDIFLLLQENAEREIELGRCRVGAHKDDIEILISGKDSRAFASQGQTRSIVLSLKLSMIKLLEETLEDSPLILLDDVDSELDFRRTERFFGSVLTGGRQVIITGTSIHPRLTDDKTVQKMEVKGGEVAILT